MNDPSPHGIPRPPSAGAGSDTAGQAGVIGIGLAAVLTFALAQGSWQWFATYIGATLLAVIFAFQRQPAWTPGVRSAYLRGLVAFSMVVGLCVAIALAPMLQRWPWLLPMSGTRSGCRVLGRYEAIRSTAALADLAGRDSAAVAYAQQTQSGKAVADCLATTTTLWLPLYGAGAALLVGAIVWSRDRARAAKGPWPQSTAPAPAGATTRPDGMK
ncbi:hypothetical protein GCM10011579_032270 [Streptomyces albiflavescens]|uniref:Uncharacterized protein n=1 Tax=Streptomyces albiflavescens TaxID=1623582 RepID=A0A918D3G6_9ACTN|nr:hypothetical protein [Streptomyces albiflavescens]GGN63668.1 hypothetical protein GCM10011579_032270 [Streptomyces albiflavescens]